LDNPSKTLRASIAGRWSKARGKYTRQKIEQVIAEAMVIAVGLGLLFLVEIEAMEQATMRRFLLLQVGIVIMMAGFLTMLRYRELQDLTKPGPDKMPWKHRVTRMKREAEVFSAFAILGFVLSLYKVGADIDLENYGGRQYHLSEADTRLAKTNICKRADLQQACDQFAELNANAKASLNNKEEKQLQLHIRSMIATVRDITGKDKPQAGKSIVEELELAKIQDDGLHEGIKLTFLISSPLLMFSAMTISRKLASAWFEASMLKVPEQAPKPLPAPARHGRRSWLVRGLRTGRRGRK
jgi:hypothetical protein